MPSRSRACRSRLKRALAGPAATDGGARVPALDEHLALGLRGQHQARPDIDAVDLTVQAADAVLVPRWVPVRPSLSAEVGERDAHLCGAAALSPFTTISISPVTMVLHVPRRRRWSGLGARRRRRVPPELGRAVDIRTGSRSGSPFGRLLRTCPC